jgi:hypothetical protein
LGYGHHLASRLLDRRKKPRSIRIPERLGTKSDVNILRLTQYFPNNGSLLRRETLEAVKYHSFTFKKSAFVKFLRKA